MAMVRLYHPELDETIEVSETAATVHRRKGWVDVDADDPIGPDLTGFGEEDLDVNFDLGRFGGRADDQIGNDEPRAGTEDDATGAEALADEHEGGF